MNEEDLIKGCIKGSHDAQMILYRRYAPVLQGICHRYITDMNDIEDIVQDSFIKILSGLRKFRNDGSFVGWMKRITVNTAINFIRNRKKMILTDIDDASSAIADIDNEEMENTSDEALLKMEIKPEDIIRAINKLPEVYKVVFNLSIMEKYSHKEISSMLGIVISNSKMRLKRAREMVQKELVLINAGLSTK